MASVASPGLFQLKLDRWKEPVLASSTDGVGTKIAVAQALDKHDTIGIDLVAMVVDDLVVCGAEPLFLQDYIAVGKVVPDKIAALVKGIAEGCVQAGCALLGGETAEHPGLMGDDDYDISGTGVGVVERSKLLGPDRVRAGDVVIAHGLVRPALQRLLAGPPRAAGDRPHAARGPRRGVRPHPRRGDAGADQDLRQGLPRADRRDRGPHASRTSPVVAWPRTWPACCPRACTPTLDRGTWTPAPVFELIAQRGRVEREEMEKTFNMGVGMVAVVAPEDVDRALAVLTARHVPAWVLGEITKASARAAPSSSATTRVLILRQPPAVVVAY